MQKFNEHILKQNVKTLLKNRDMTQQQLADVLKITQSNVSKALNEKDKKCFSVDQVYSIALYFNVSTDWLLGYDPENGLDPANRKSTNIDLKKIGTILSELSSCDKAKWTKISVEERVFKAVPDEEDAASEEERANDIHSQDNHFHSSLKPHKTVSEYAAVYFPNYWDPKETEGNFAQRQELYKKVQQSGNDTGNEPLNRFLEKYLDILRAYKENQLSEEAYQIVVKDYINQLETNSL